MVESHKDKCNDSPVAEDEEHEEINENTSSDSERSFKQKRRSQQKKRVRILESEDENSNSFSLDANSLQKGHHAYNDPDDAIPSSPSCSQWVQCDNPKCQKWRRVDFAEDLNEFIDTKWMCGMNEDGRRNTCEASQETVPSDTENECYMSHKPGTLLWGKVNGYPWWPCIVEDDPDYKTFYWNYQAKSSSQTKTTIHVTFFGQEASRAWLQLNLLRPFTGNEHLRDMGAMTFRKINFKNAVKEAFTDAKKCLKLSFKKRLETFGFHTRYLGNDKVEQDRKKRCVQKTDDEKTNLVARKRSNQQLEEEKKETKDAEAQESMLDISDDENGEMEEKIFYPDIMFDEDDLAETNSDEIINCFASDSKQIPSDKDKHVFSSEEKKEFLNKMSRFSREKKKMSKKVSGKSKHSKNRNHQQNTRKLTREEIMSVPKLVKPTLLPIDYTLVAEMADKLVKEEKEKAEKESKHVAVNLMERDIKERDAERNEINEEKETADAPIRCYDDVCVEKIDILKGTPAPLPSKEEDEDADVHGIKRMEVGCTTSPKLSHSLDGSLEEKGKLTGKKSGVKENKKHEKQKRGHSKEKKCEKLSSESMTALSEQEQREVKIFMENAAPEPKQEKKKTEFDQKKSLKQNIENPNEDGKGENADKKRAKLVTKGKKGKGPTAKLKETDKGEKKSTKTAKKEKSLGKGLESSFEPELTEHDIGIEGISKSEQIVKINELNSTNSNQRASLDTSKAALKSDECIKQERNLHTTVEKTSDRNVADIKQQVTSRKLKKSKFSVPRRDEVAKTCAANIAPGGKRIKTEDTGIPDVEANDHHTKSGTKLCPDVKLDDQHSKPALSLFNNVKDDTNSLSEKSSSLSMEVSVERDKEGTKVCHPEEKCIFNQSEKTEQSEDIALLGIKASPISKGAKVQPAENGNVIKLHSINTENSSPNSKVVKIKNVMKKKSRLHKIKDQYEDRRIVCPARASVSLKCKESSAFLMALESPKSKTTVKKKDLLGKKSRKTECSDERDYENQLSQEKDNELENFTSTTSSMYEAQSESSNNLDAYDTFGLDDGENEMPFPDLSSPSLKFNCGALNESKFVSNRCGDPVMPVVEQINETMDDSPEF